MKYGIRNRPGDYIKIIKGKGLRYTFDEVKELINFDEWYVYKYSKRFIRVEEKDYEKYAGMFLSKRNIDKECEFLNSFYGIFYLVKPPHKEMMKIKIIDEI